MCFTTTSVAAITVVVVVCIVIPFLFVIYSVLHPASRCLAPLFCCALRSIRPHIIRN